MRRVAFCGKHTSMRSSKHLLLCVAAVLGLNWLGLAAEDSPDQAKAREALRQAVGPPATTQSAVAPAVQTPAGTDSAALEQAREQLRRKMAELEGQQGGAKPTTVSQPVVTATPSAAAGQGKEEELRRALEEAMKQPATAAGAEAKAKADLQARTKAEAKARAEAEKQAQKDAKARQEAEKRAAKTTKAPPQTAASEPKPSAKMAVPALPTFAPMEPPPLPISADKQRQLAELLEQYKADKVTPDEYQRQRAKILSEK